MKLERVILDVGTLPHSDDDVAFADELTRRLHQKPKDLEGAASEKHRRSPRPKLAAGEIDLPVA